MDESLAQFSLADLARENFLRLSYGQRRRVLLARAMVHRPQVLLLDEPLDGLDAEAMNRIRKLLSALSDTGVNVITVSHRPTEMPDVSRG